MSELDGGMSETKPTNHQEISWFIRRLNHYMIEDDEPLIEEFKELLEDPNIEKITDKEIREYNERVQETIKICNVLDRFPMKKIEGYLRKKKIDNLNRLHDSVDGAMSAGPGI